MNQIRVQATDGVGRAQTEPATTGGENMNVLGRQHQIVQVIPLEGERYPALVSVWDNDDDAIYDQV